MKKKRERAICTWRPFNQSDTRFVIPQTFKGHSDRVFKGLCGLLVSTNGPTCMRAAGHEGYCS